MAKKYDFIKDLQKLDFKKEKDISSTKNKLKEGYSRYTTVMKDENLTKFKALVYYTPGENAQKLINEILEFYFEVIKKKDDIDINYLVEKYQKEVINNENL